MKKVDIRIISLILFLLFSINCRDDIRSSSLKTNSDSLSGVYKGTLDMYGTCVTSTAEAEIIFNLSTDPILVIYDGSVLEDTKMIKNDVYVGEFNLGTFIYKNNNVGFSYSRIFDQWAGFSDDEVSKPYILRKISDINSYNDKIEAYLSDDVDFRKFWSNFKKAFVKQDFDLLDKLTYYPLVDEANLNGKIIINNKNELSRSLLAYLNKRNVNKENYIKEAFDDFPLRFSDSDPCFPKEYGLLSYMPYLFFKKINGEYKLFCFRAFN